MGLLGLHTTPAFDSSIILFPSPSKKPKINLFVDKYVDYFPLEKKMEKDFFFIIKSEDEKINKGYLNEIFNKITDNGNDIKIIKFND